MSVLDEKRRLAELSNRIESGEPLLDSEYKFISSRLSRIACGEDANVVFGVKYRKGEKELGARRRRNQSFVLHWLACAIGTIEEGGLGLTLHKALEQAELLGKSGQLPEYSYEYLNKIWHKNNNSHMKKKTRDTFDNDFPYQV